MPPRPPVQHLRKLHALLGSAVSDLRQGFWEPAVHGLYYACFHMALALLSTAGVGPSTHWGVREMLSVHFVMTGPLPAHFGRLFSQLLGDREIADYSVTTDISPEAAHEAAAKALEFLDGALPLLAQRAPETAGAMPDLSRLRAVVQDRS